MRWLWPFLFVAASVVTITFGGSYAAMMINSMIGPWTSVAIHQDGSTSAMQFARDLPRPEWVPVHPDASIVQASKVTVAEAPSGFHSLEIATRASSEEIKRFYTERLTASGFDVVNLGLMTLNPATAQMLGLEDTLFGNRPATDDFIYVHIRTPEGLIPSRLVEIRWAKISEYPRQVEMLRSAKAQ